MTAGLSFSIADAAGSSGESRFAKTVLFLQDSPSDVRANFVKVGLLELAEIYMAEADLARKQARDQARSARLLSWAARVDEYADQLLWMLDDIELGLPFGLSINRRGVVTIEVAGAFTMLTHPRLYQQMTYEQRVLTEFCQRYDCRELTAVSSQSNFSHTSMRSPDWSFDYDGPVCERDGISVKWSNVFDLGRKRRMCKQLFVEISTLAAAIAQQSDHGVDIDWGELTIRVADNRDQHLVELNKAGDSVVASLPLLYANSGLLTELTAWLRASNRTDSEVMLRINAAYYGWEENSI